MQNNQFNRFTAAPWFEKIRDSRIMVFGVGGVGSWLTMYLARTGASIIVVDMDTVDDVNLSGQLYGPNQIGKSKVDAIVEVVSSLNNEVNITPINIEVKDDEKSQWYSYLKLCDVVVTGFDSLPPRQLVYEKWKKAGKADSLFLDMRMSMEQGNILTVNKGKVNEEELYESSFFSAEEAVQQPCSAKATSHCGALIASLSTSIITNWFTDKGDFRNVPRKLDFYLPIVKFEL